MVDGRAPHGARGLKRHLRPEQSLRGTGRAPHGARGSSYPLDYERICIAFCRINPKEQVDIFGSMINVTKIP